MAISESKIMSGLGLIFVLGLVVCVSSVSSAKFGELFQPSWATDHFVYEGELLKLKLDNFSGNSDPKKKSYLLLHKITTRPFLMYQKFKTEKKKKL